MIPVVLAIIWAALCGLFLWRLDRFAHRWLDQKDPEKRARAYEQPPIPDDLMALAMQEDAGSDEATKVARQGVVDAIRERYRLYKDWNKVRTAMGTGHVG